MLYLILFLLSSCRPNKNIADALLKIETPILSQLQTGNEQENRLKILLFLEEGGDANSVLENGQPLLHYAISQNSAYLVAHLLFSGALITTEYQEKTPLSIAISVSSYTVTVDVRILQLLILFGAESEYKSLKDRMDNTRISVKEEMDTFMQTYNTYKQSLETRSTMALIRQLKDNGDRTKALGSIGINLNMEK